MSGRDEQFARMAADLGANLHRDRERAGEQQRQLELAMHDPIEIHQITTSAQGIADIGPKLRAFVYGLPDGHRYHIHMDPQACRTLGEALLKPFDGESAGAEETGPNGSGS